MIKLNNKNSGYTLIELLVAIAVFSIVLVIAMASYMSVYRSQKRAIENEKIQTATHNVIETIAKEFRMGEINYDNVRYEDAPIDIVWIENQSGAEIRFACDCDGDSLTYTDGTNESDLIPEGVTVEECGFYVDSIGQERLTVFLKLSASVVGGDATVETNIQTTISSRHYE